MDKTKIKQLVDAVKYIQGKSNISLREAFTILISYFGTELDIEGAILKTNIDVINYLHDNININNYKEEDYLGASFEELNLFDSSIKGTPLKTINIDVFKANIKKYVNNLSNNVKTILIRDISTGFLIMEFYKINKNIIIFGIEEEYILYQMAVINCKLNNIPVKIIHNDTINLTPKSKEWNTANCFK